MQRARKALLVVAAIAACFGLARWSSSSGASNATPACITYWPEARYRPYGYDHIVHVANACTSEARCAVSTNVDPKPIIVSIPARTTIEVVTRVGSPASELTPNVECSLAKQSP